MAETYGARLDEVRDLLARQVAGWRRLLHATRASTAATSETDPEAFERVLAEQVDALSELRALEGERGRLLRSVGDETTPEVASLKQDLRVLAAEVARANRRSRFVLERNGALVEARLGLHRRVGNAGDESTAGLHRIA